MAQLPDDDTVIARTRCWISKAVVALNLCPFARKPYEGEQVRYVVSHAQTPDELFTELQHELEHLRATDPEVVETTVLIHPFVLQDFYDYNDFLGVVDELIETGGYASEFQVASLHPDYQFAGTQPEDAENYTNRSPYPILHLLREELLARAISSYARPDKIPERNIRLMNELGAEKMRALLDECMQIGEVRNSVPSPSGGGPGRGE
ncbi:MAG TPA: DUF1415 domain-containing protein [Gammaproteobacteria bacterium]